MNSEAHLCSHCRDKVTAEWYFYHSLYVSGIIVEWEKDYEMLSSRHSSDNGVMTSQNLWLPAQVIHRPGPLPVSCGSERNSQGSYHSHWTSRFKAAIFVFSCLPTEEASRLQWDSSKPVLSKYVPVKLSEDMNWERAVVIRTGPQ